MTDDQNSQKMPVDCIHIVDIEFSVDPWDLFHGCMRNNAVIRKNYHPSYLIPSAGFIRKKIKLNRLGS